MAGDSCYSNCCTQCLICLSGSCSLRPVVTSQLQPASPGWSPGKAVSFPETPSAAGPLPWKIPSVVVFCHQFASPSFMNPLSPHGISPVGTRHFNEGQNLSGKNCKQQPVRFHWQPAGRPESAVRIRTGKTRMLEADRQMQAFLVRTCRNAKVGFFAE